MQDRLPLALCYKIKKNGRVSYIFGTEHAFYKVPKELTKLMREKKINRVLVEDSLPLKITGGTQGIPFSIGLPLDKLIVRAALQHNIKVVGLDDLNDQSLTKIYCDTYFRYNVFNYFYPDQAVDSTKKRIERNGAEENPYLRQDMTALFKSVRESRRQDPENRQKIRDGRNKKWKLKIMRCLNRGKALIAVGYGHLIDFEGYIDILLEEGYEIIPYPVKIKPNVELIASALSDPGTDQLIAAYQENQAKKALRNLFDSFLHAADHDFQNLTISQKVKFDYILNDLLRDYLLKDPKLCAIQISLYSLIPYIKNNNLNDKIQNDIQKVLGQSEEKNTNKYRGERRRARFLAALFFPHLLNKDDPLLKKSPPDHKAPPDKVLPVIIDDNMPNSFKTILEKAAENDALFLDDISDELITKAIDDIKEKDLNALICLFKDYQHASYPLLIKNYPAWQARLVFQKMLQTLAATPYQKRTAIRVMKEYYEKEIERITPPLPTLNEHNEEYNRVERRFALYEAINLPSESKILPPIEDKKVTEISEKIGEAATHLHTTVEKRKKINAALVDLGKMNKLLLRPHQTVERIDFLEKQILTRLHRDDKILGNHSAAWKYQLANAIFCLTGVGAFFVIGNYVWSRQLLWSKTKAQEGLEKIEEIIHEEYGKCKKLSQAR